MMVHVCQFPDEPGLTYYCVYGNELWYGGLFNIFNSPANLLAYRLEEHDQEEAIHVRPCVPVEFLLTEQGMLDFQRELLENE